MRHTINKSGEHCQLLIVTEIKLRHEITYSIKYLSLKLALHCNLYKYNSVSCEYHGIVQWKKKLSLRKMLSRVS
jgi:hypothetical protein